MSQWIVEHAGTPEGARLALILALTAAILHALFGALQKGKIEPWRARGGIDLANTLLAAPVALFVVPWPEPHMWPIFAGMLVIHLGYKVAQAAAYTSGAYTVVYPVVRGMGPVFTVIGAGILFGEVFTGTQWLGLLLLSSGIFGLAVYNLVFLVENRATLPRALTLAVITGFFVAAYTTFDAYGIRATADPFTFLAWFFFLDGMTMPLLLLVWRPVGPPPPFRTWARLSVTGALVAIGSFGSILIATRLDQVGEAAVIRETSTVFAALMGWLLLGEKVGPRRLALMTAIAAGAVVVEFGG